MTTIKMIVIAYISSILFSNKGINAELGINWGINSKGTLMPSMVVDVLLQNNIKLARVYDDAEDLIKAFAGTGIGLAITCYKPEQNVSSFEQAKAYVHRQILRNPTVDIRYLHVGNNVLAMARNTKQPFDPIVKGFKWLNDALVYYKIQDKTKVVISNAFTAILKTLPNNSRPSDADFKDDIKDIMLEILNIYNQTNTPFMFDFFPLAYIWDYQMDLEFALFDNKSSFIVTDINEYQYNNLFDFVYDSFVWLLEKYGFGNLKIICTQVGWPTDGFYHSTREYAERFYKGLLPKVTSNRGTPMRPGKPIDIYIHALSDEKNNPAKYPFSRHWGIYTNNGRPKFKIDLSGQGRDIFPTSARGIKLMPLRWCSFTGIYSNWSVVQEQVDYACSFADCTSLMPGGSCGMLTSMENVTYAFNSYYQSKYQDEDACKFNGLGKVICTDPSTNGCEFSVEVARGSLDGNLHWLD